jgi:glutaredoxin
MHAVTFYTRAGCHLCDDALEVVERVRRDVPFELVLVDLDADADAKARYWDKIPVVEVDGRMHAKYRVDEASFRRRLETA